MCYVLPVIVHFKLLRHRQLQTQQWQRQKEQQFQVGGVPQQVLGVDPAAEPMTGCGVYRHTSVCALCLQRAWCKSITPLMSISYLPCWDAAPPLCLQAAIGEAGAASVAPGSPDPGLTAPLLVRHSSASSLTDMVVIPTSPATVGGELLPSALDLSMLQPLSCWPNCPAWLQLLLRMLLPVLVLCVGLGFSIAALSVAFNNMRKA